MAIIFPKLPVFEDKDYTKNGSNGKCPGCNNHVVMEKSLSKPETPGTNVRCVLRCVKCKRVLRIQDGIDNVISREDELER